MKTIGSISYGIAALAFVVLAVLLAVNWRGRRPGGYLLAASALTAAWAAVLASVDIDHMPLLLVYLAEVLRSSAWLLALLAIAETIVPRALVLTARAVCALAVGSIFAMPVLTKFGLNPLLLLSRSGLVMALIGLVLVEQIYRNSTQAARGAVKYLTAGIGGLFAYDLFLYSQAELLRGITLEAWNARGLINALAVPLITLAVRRSPQWSLEIFVSRQAVFFTTTFLGVGAYLLVMSVGGYYVRQIGGDWGRVGQITFFAGAAVVLFYLIASPALRRHARVFISKHFYRNKYDYRIEWLRFISTLVGRAGDRRAPHGPARDRADLFQSRRHPVRAGRARQAVRAGRQLAAAAGSATCAPRDVRRRGPAALPRSHALDHRPAGVPALAGHVRERDLAALDPRQSGDPHHLAAHAARSHGRLRHAVLSRRRRSS